MCYTGRWQGSLANRDSSVSSCRRSAVEAQHPKGHGTKLFPLLQGLHRTRLRDRLGNDELHCSGMYLHRGLRTGLRRTPTLCPSPGLHTYNTLQIHARKWSRGQRRRGSLDHRCSALIIKWGVPGDGHSSMRAQAGGHVCLFVVLAGGSSSVKPPARARAPSYDSSPSLL